jgi:hypothetical protein
MTKMQRAERMVWLFELGVSLTEIGLIYDVSSANVTTILNLRGLDAEERALALEALPEVARVHQSLSYEVLAA